METLKERFDRAIDCSNSPEKPHYIWGLEYETDDGQIENYAVTAHVANIGVHVLPAEFVVDDNTTKYCIILGNNFANCSSEALYWVIVSFIKLHNWQRTNGNKCLYYEEFENNVLSGVVSEIEKEIDLSLFDDESWKKNLSESDVIKIFDELFDSADQQQHADITKLNYCNRCRDLLRARFGEDAAQEYSARRGI